MSKSVIVTSGFIFKFKLFYKPLNVCQPISLLIEAKSGPFKVRVINEPNLGGQEPIAPTRAP